MSGPTPEAESEGLEDEEALDESVDDLLALAKDYRAGTADVPRDMARCYATYCRAAERGSAEAEYAVALFHLTGGVVAQDLKEGVRHLRTAADGGSVHAKVYLGNLYELGIHFSKDSEKADVWYRSAARAAGIAQAADDPELPRAMAELGCARYALVLDADSTIPAAERARYLKKARAFGYELRIRGAERASALPASPTSPESLAATASALDAAPAVADEVVPTRVVTEAPSEAEGTATGKATGTGTGKATATAKAKPKVAVARAPARAPVPWGLAASAFLYAALFTAAALGAAYLAAHGARDLHARGGPLPLFGDHVDRVFPTVLGLGAVLPSLLVYRFGAVARAVVASSFGFAAGFFLWSKVSLVDLRVTQATACAVAAFLGALLILGLMGGAKPRGKA